MVLRLANCHLSPILKASARPITNAIIRCRTGKTKKRKLVDDGDDTNLPLGARKLPAFIALDTDDTSVEQISSGSTTTSSKKGKSQIV